MKKEYYKALDGIRSIAAICIILVHVAKNANYNIEGYIYTNLICRLEVFVSMFFVLSGFAMSCGYYNKIKNGEINLNDFYSKRFIRIWPFFAVLVFLEIILNFSGKETIYEALADLTLLFGFFPCSSIEVVGVGWTLGVIFGFYCLFPFFVFLLWSKKRAWASLAISLIIHHLCQEYFLNNGHVVLCNVMMWLCYFIAGGIIFLYKDELKKIVSKNRIVFFIIACICSLIWIFTPNNIFKLNIYTAKTILMDILWIIYAISIESIILANKITKFIGDISFEVYLSHMIFYRLIEKMKLLHISNVEVVSYIVSCLFVIGLTLSFAFVVKKILNIVLSNKDHIMKKIKII